MRNALIGVAIIVALAASGLAATGPAASSAVPAVNAVAAQPATGNAVALKDAPVFRDNRKGVFWSRTRDSRLAVPMLAEAPKMDGDLGDKAWAKAAPLLTWTGGADGTGMPSCETKGAIGQFGNKLYLAFRCMEDFPADIVTNRPIVSQNDCVEIFLDPEHRHTTWAKITVTAGGRVEASRLVEPKPGEVRNDAGWKPKIEAKVGRGERAWTVEVAIDLDDVIGAEPTRSYRPTIWGFGLARERRPAVPEKSAYSMGCFEDAAHLSEINLMPATVATVVLANGALVNLGDTPAAAKVEVRISDQAGKVLGQETVVRQVAPGSEVKLIDREISYRMPQHGLLKLTLLEPGSPQWETFAANVWGGVGASK